MQLDKISSTRLAGTIMLMLLALLALFHLMVLVNLLPSDIVWGGTAVDPDADMAALENISLGATLLFMLIVAVRVGFLWKSLPRIVTTIGMWLICAFFVLNTVGNIASDVTIENLIFAPLTIVLALLALRLAFKK